MLEKPGTAISQNCGHWQDASKSSNARKPDYGLLSCTGERMKKVAKIAWVVVLVCLATGMWAQDQDEDSSAPRPPKHGIVDLPAPPTEVPSDYVIGADDTLHVSVWKEPDLTVTLPVRPDGKISLPLLDDVQAAGLTPMALAGSVREKLKKYIADPRVTVVVTAMNSRRIFVTGEVTHSGAMALLPSMTVLQAISAAGFTQFAKPKDIYLLRVGNGHQQKIPFNYKDVVKGKHPDENIRLQPGDTIVVP
jgi:polysaccharide biosynthesis/export protein